MIVHSLQANKKSANKQDINNFIWADEDTAFQ